MNFTYVVALDLVGEADLVADLVAELGVELLGHARRDAGRGDAPRLRARRSAPFAAAAHREADLGQLRRLARAGLARDDDDRVRVDRGGDVDDARRDRQLSRERHAIAQAQAWSQHGRAGGTPDWVVGNSEDTVSTSARSGQPNVMPCASGRSVE